MEATAFTRFQNPESKNYPFFLYRSHQYSKIPSVFRLLSKGRPGSFLSVFSLVLSFYFFPPSFIITNLPYFMITNPAFLHDYKSRLPS